MHRAPSTLLRFSAALSLPLIAACPQDSTPITEGTTTGTSEPTDDESTSNDPDSSTSLDPDTSATIDPDSSTGADSSSSGDDATTGTVGCGDGSVDLGAGEECDGANLDGRDCTTQDFSGGVLACNADCTLDTSGCTYECGDGEVQGDEQCEADDLDGNTCMDAGFDGGVLACNADCTLDASGCENYLCGDGLRAGPEACDGEDLGNQTCVSLGYDSGTVACLEDCSGFDISGCFVCGNGILDPGEVCDGSDFGDETCVSQGLDGGELGCAPDCTLDLSECVGCGNGDADPGEECDGSDFDGTTCVDLGFDGGIPTCTAECTISGLSCAGVHTFCATPASAIGPGVGSTLSTIEVAGLAGALRDVDVFVDADHSRVSDLDIDVRHVGSDIGVSLADDQCGATSDILATFDQDADALPDCVQPIAIEGHVLPLGDLDDYLDDDAVGSGNGTWELTIADQVAGEGGALGEWCVELTTGCGGDPVTEALAACAIEFPNCVVTDGGVVGFAPPSDQGANCDGVEAPWRFYCTEDDVDGSNYHCAACEVGEILVGHDPCGCTPGSAPVIGSFC